MQNTRIDVDMRTNPFRGILAEIAREEGVSRQAVQYGIRVRNFRYLRLLVAKIHERRAVIREIERQR